MKNAILLCALIGIAEAIGNNTFQYLTYLFEFLIFFGLYLQIVIWKNS